MQTAAPKTPFLLCVEGIDGAGKTTLAMRIADHLRACGYAVVLSKEPTHGTFGKQLRDSAATGRLTPQRELELLLLDRREHVAALIAPALARGEIVILDRYYYSNAAYQGAEGLDAGAILAQNETFAPRPDLALLLDVEPILGLQRIRARGDVANHFETPASLERCRTIFRAIDRPELQLVDASASADTVYRESRNAFVKIFAAKIRATADASQAAQILHPLLQNAAIATGLGSA